MSLFDKFKTPAPPAAPAPATPTVNLHKSGSVKLAKGASVNLDKGSGKITATCQWPPATDYDVYAIVVYRDGRTETVATFGTKEGRGRDFSLATTDGAVRHLGDVGRSSAAVASETVQITLNDNIHAVIPVVYSAQSNGTGSFRKYQVSMTIDNGSGAAVTIDADSASSDNTVYSCVPGVIINDPTGVRIEAREQYSAPRSERRPTVDGNLNVQMDAGATNSYK